MVHSWFRSDNVHRERVIGPPDPLIVRCFRKIKRFVERQNFLRDGTAINYFTETVKFWEHDRSLEYFVLCSTTIQRKQECRRQRVPHE